MVVTDHMKFGRQGLVGVCDFGALTDIVPDRPPRGISATLKAAGVTVTLALTKESTRYSPKPARSDVYLSAARRGHAWVMILFCGMCWGEG